jgi:3-oxoacyl-[acyl-carrier protein] reductase
MVLKDKIAIVTGAGSGVGRAAALEFAGQGAKVVCCGRRKEKLDETAAQVKKLPGDALALPTDITRPDSVQSTVKTVLAHYGGVDILFNNAGSFLTLGALWENDPDDWWQDVAVNFRGAMLCARAVLPHMVQKDAGVIINITAQAGTARKPGCTAYGGSKAALLHMTMTLAEELKQRKSNVLVFGLDPGFNRTEMTEALGRMPGAPEWLPGVPQALAAPRGDHPENVARTAVELMQFNDPILRGRTWRVGMTADEIRHDARRIEEEDLLVPGFRFLSP